MPSAFDSHLRLSMIKSKKSSLCSIDEDIPFVMETEEADVSEFTKAATLNQAGRPDFSLTINFLLCKGSLIY